MESIRGQGSFLPEHLLNHAVRVEVDRRDGDVLRGLTTGQGVASEDYDIAPQDRRWANKLNSTADPARSRPSFTRSWATRA